MPKGEWRYGRDRRWGLSWRGEDGCAARNAFPRQHGEHFGRSIRMDAYDREYENPPPVAEAERPTPLNAEEFVGDTYGVFNRKKRNAKEGTGPIGRFAGGVEEVVKKPKKGDSMSVWTALRELLIHAAFLVIICIIAFSSCTSTSYYFANMLNNLFTTTKSPSNKMFSDIATMDDAWEYINNQMMAGLYWQPINSNGTIEDTNSSDATILYDNRLLGRPRVRMLKVTNDSCEVVESFSREIKECYAQYAKDKEDRTTFGPTPPTEAFIYQTAKELENGDTEGAISTYGGGGFVQTLPLDDQQTALDMISNLMANRWIDRGTRIVIVDFAVYNANINLFCAIKLLLEIPATGGVLPSATFTSLRLIRYISTFDHVVLVCEGIFVAFTIFFIAEEVIDILKWRLRYFTVFWNIIDLLVIALSITAIVLSISRTLIANRRIGQLLEGELTSSPLDNVVNAENKYNNVAACLLFFAWIKVFKYISFNKTMSQLSSTLSRSAKDIGGFAVIFFVFFFAYAQFGYLVFGTQIADYSTFYDAVFALLRTILGDFNFPALVGANRVLGPIFFITYVFFVFFVLLNMFLAIINDSYTEVKAELAGQHNEFEIANFFKKGYYRVLHFLHLTKKDDSVDPTLGYKEWKEELTKLGYSEQEIEQKFIKYNVESWNSMDDGMKAEVEKELERDRADKERRSDYHRDIVVVGRRIDHIEHAILSVASRMEEVANRIRTVENEKVRAREQANRISSQSFANGNNDYKID